MKFVGRVHELAVLQRAYESDASAFVPIYGRRRIGKSELVVHFLDGKPGLYFVGKKAPAATQLREFLEIAARALGEPLLAGARIEDWKSALTLVVDRWPRAAKLVLVLDEFQWTAAANPELPSILQELWDRAWSKSGRMLLILCGSYLGFMEREVLGRESPLFGRRTAQILLRPFNHLEAVAFHPGFSTADQFRAYAIAGGVPPYLAAFEDQCSIAQNIAARLLEETAALAREPEFLLREELRDLPTYHAVLLALAQGQTNPAHLARTTGIDPRTLNYYLATLSELGYVQRRYPLGAEKPSLRTVRYALEDPLLRFWFRFVFPHQSLLRTLGAQRGFAELIQPELEAYFGHCFERLCRETLPWLYAREGVRTAFTVGEYWDSQVQIDVVGVRQDNWTDLGECKWGNVASLSALDAELEDKVRRFPNARQATIGRRLFVRALRSKTRPPREGREGPRVHTLEDLYRTPANAVPIR